MSVKIFYNHSVKFTVLSRTGPYEQPQKELLKMFKEQKWHKCEPQNDHHKDRIEAEQKPLHFLVDVGQWNQIVSHETHSYHQNCNSRLSDRQTHIFKSLHLHRLFISLSASQIQTVFQIFSKSRFDREINRDQGHKETKAHPNTYRSGCQSKLNCISCHVKDHKTNDHIESEGNRDASNNTWHTVEETLERNHRNQMTWLEAKGSQHSILIGLSLYITYSQTVEQLTS